MASPLPVSKPVKLTLAPLVLVMFCCVSGGPYGLEPVMRSGAGMGLLLILTIPIIWAVPVALMTAELTSALPVEGGYYVCTKRALGPFAGFLCGWWTWVYSWIDVAIYPVLFSAYLSAYLGSHWQFGGLAHKPLASWLLGLTMRAA